MLCVLNCEVYLKKMVWPQYSLSSNNKRQSNLNNIISDNT